MPRALGLDEKTDRIEPLGDGVRVSERRCEPCPEQPGAGAGHGTVDDRKQAAGGAPFQRRREFQVAPGRGVDRHRCPGRGRAEPREPG